MIKNICFYQYYSLKLNTIKALVIIMYIDQYFLHEELRTIKASNNIEKKALPKDINNNKLRDLEIEGLINNNKENIDLDENINNY